MDVRKLKMRNTMGDLNSGLRGSVDGKGGKKDTIHRFTVENS